MENLAQKCFTSSRNLAYSYSLSPPPSTSSPTLLFLHGWPDSHTLWQFIAPEFLTLGYGVLLIDLPGLGRSSRPLDSSLYGIGSVCRDISELLVSEKVDKILPVGHDWGSNVATRMCLFFPERCVGVVLLNVGYIPPAKEGAAPGPKTIEELNDFFEKMTGYRRFEYHEFFLADDAAMLCEANLESLWSAMHRDAGPEGMREMFCTPGFLREYVSAGKTDPLKSYARNGVLRKLWIEEMKRDGIRASFNWYHAIWEGHHATAEKGLSGSTGVLDVPVLYLSADEDVLCPGDEIQQQVHAGLLPDLTTHEIHAGHWVPCEAPEEVVKAMKAWLSAKIL